jgi:type VI secretion system protein VasD
VLKKLTIIGLFICTSLFGLISCAVVSDPPTQLVLQIQAADDLNPAADGSPSPVAVLIYELSANSNFQASDFFALYDETSTTLGSDLISRESQNVVPGQALIYEKKLSPLTRYIGVISAFREIDNAEWRVVLPIKPKILNDAMITLKGNSISLMSK